MAVAVATVVAPLQAVRDTCNEGETTKVCITCLLGRVEHVPVTERIELRISVVLIETKQRFRHI